MPEVEVQHGRSSTIIDLAEPGAEELLHRVVCAAIGDGQVPVIRARRPASVFGPKSTYEKPGSDQAPYNHP